MINNSYIYIYLWYREKLVSLIGADTVRRIIAHFPVASNHIDAIRLRRCAAHGQCINFHLDHATHTMQVALNGDDEYCGGRLVFATEGGFASPARPAGTITIHDDGVVHGVTQLQSGVRYGLFFLSCACKSCF